MNIYIGSIEINYCTDEYETDQFGASKSLRGLFKSFCEYLIETTRLERKDLHTRKHKIGEEEEVIDFFFRIAKLDTLKNVHRSMNHIYQNFGDTYRGFEIDICEMEVTD